MGHCKCITRANSSDGAGRVIVLAPQPPKIHDLEPARPGWFCRLFSTKHACADSNGSSRCADAAIPGGGPGRIGPRREEWENHPASRLRDVGSRESHLRDTCNQLSSRV